jgi:hypothetical protein
MRSALMIIPILLGACRHHQPAPQQVAARLRTATTAQMDSATIERLCVHPDSVRSGRAACVLQDQSASPPGKRIEKPTPPR